MSGPNSGEPVAALDPQDGGRWVDRLFAWRSEYGFGKLEALVLALYTAIVGFTLHFHEPWMDEAQSWLIARDLGLAEIFRHRLHFEGHPGLWYVLLHVLHLLRVPWPAIGYIAALFAVAGVYVWLRWSPFPAILRYLLPFTFYLIYQYAVVQRSYVMFAVLLFGLCALYTARRRHVIAFAVVAGLLANLCLQGTLVAGIFTLLYAWDAYRQRRVRAGVEPISASSQQVPARVWTTGAAIVVFAWTAAIATAIPAPEQTGVVPFPLGTAAGHKFLEKFVGETPAPKYSDPAFEAFYAHIQDHPPMPRSASFRSSPRQWFLHELGVPRSRKSLRNLPWTLASFIKSSADRAIYPVSEWYLLGVAFYLALLVWALWRRGLRYFLPALAFLAAGDALTRGPHHTGLLLISVLAGVWVASKGTAPAPQISEAQPRRVWLDRVFVGVTAAVFAAQVEWAAHAVIMDHRDVYDPGKETAEFLQKLPAGTRMASFDEWAVAIQPYFPSNPFFNLTSASWTWRTDANINYNHRAVLDARPDVVVYSSEVTLPTVDPSQVENPVPPNPILVDLQAHGYVETHRFCGERFARSSVSHRACDAIFEPAERVKR